MGISYVRFLTVHPLRIGLYAFFSTLFFVSIIGAIGMGFTGWSTLFASVFSLLMFLAGYIGMTKRLLAREDPRPVPELVRQQGDPGLGHTAVIYFTHGEPETYDPIGWINQFNEFDEQKIGFVPLVARPFFIYNLRRSYMRVGRSEHRRTHLRMVRALENEFRNMGDQATRFYISFLDDNPRPHRFQCPLHLLDILQVQNDLRVRMIFKDNLSPSLLCPEQTDGFTAVVMPMRL